MKTTTKVKKWGNSLAIRIPQAIVSNMGLSTDSNMQITSNGTIVTLKPENPKKVTLSGILDKITPENVHKEVDWGKPAGKEIW